MNISYKLLLSILITFPCLGMEQSKSQPQGQFPFEKLPSDMQKEIVNKLVQDTITQKSEALSQAQSYREYKELLIQELNSYKSVSKSMKALVSHALHNNKELIPALLPIKKSFWKKANDEIQKELISFNLNISDNIDATDVRNYTALMLLAERYRSSTAEGRQIFFNLIKILLDNGANPNLLNSDKKTVLSFDAFDHTLVGLLLNNGAQDIPDNDGCTILHLLLLNNYFISKLELNKKIAKLIIESPCNKPYLENIHAGLSPILIEISKDQPDQEIIELLLKNGVNPRCPAFFGLSALQYLQAAVNNRPELAPILELLEKYAEKTEPNNN